MSFSRFLDDPEHRETFEAAHSVVLAIFAAHTASEGQSQAASNFISHLVPFYAESLIKVRLMLRELPIQVDMFAEFSPWSFNN
jgi:hypothetical protein